MCFNCLIITLSCHIELFYFVLLLLQPLLYIVSDIVFDDFRSICLLPGYDTCTAPLNRECILYIHRDYSMILSVSNHHNTTLRWSHMKKCPIDTNCATRMCINESTYSSNQVELCHLRFIFRRPNFLLQISTS